MSASIRSLRNGLTPVDDSSRDDLVVGDVVNVSALVPATNYAWVLSFVPDGSTATFSGSSTAVSPGNFTVDLPGPYLVRLTTDVGLPTESTQYVRLRVLTSSLGLRLVAAGERRDSTGVIPVDASPEGWANDQNYNLQTLEAAISTGGTHTSRSRVDFTFASASPIIVAPLNAGDVLVRLGLKYTTTFDDPAATVVVGDTVTPNLYLTAAMSSPSVGGQYVDETYADIAAPENLTVTITPGVSTQGAGFIVFDFYRA